MGNNSTGKKSLTKIRIRMRMLSLRAKMTFDELKEENEDEEYGCLQIQHATA